MLNKSDIKKFFLLDLKINIICGIKFAIQLENKKCRI